MLSVFDRPRADRERAQARRCGYIVKSVNPLDLPSAIRQAFDETVYPALGLPEDVGASARDAAGLTEREIAILEALARGPLERRDREASSGCTEQTVKFHLTNIYRKLGVANRTEAARYAYQQGLVEPLAAGDPLVAEPV